MMQNLMRSVVTISRPTTSPDASGGINSTLTNVYVDQPALITYQKRGNRVVLFEQRQIQVTHMIGFNVPLNLLRGDIVVFGSRKFQIIGMRNLNEAGLVLSVDAIEYIA